MSASLQSAALQMGLFWSDQNVLSGFDTGLVPNKLTASIAPTVSATAANQSYFVQGTLAALGSITIDLSTLVTPMFGTSISPTGAYLILVKGSGAAWTYDAGAANQFYWFLTNFPNSGISGNDGDAFAYGSTTAGAISGGSKNIRITNLSGSATLTYTLSVILKTA